MPQQDLLPCDVYQITFPNWPQLHQAAKDRFGAVVLRQAQRDFFGAAPGRRGFTGLQQVDNTIAGFYVQEGLREGLEGNSPTELSPIANANFEKLFFAVVLDVGYVILQRRKLTGYVTMNYTVMVEEFKQMLFRAVQETGSQIAALRLEKFFRKRTQEEMRQFFFGAETSSVEVDDLYYKTVPDTIQLSNPDPLEEPLLKRIFNNDFQSLEQETFRAAPGKDLRKTKSAKAAAGAGTIKKVVNRLPGGGSDVILVEQDENVDVPIDDSKQYVSRDEVEALNAIINRRFKDRPTRQPVSREDLGPLFNQ